MAGAAAATSVAGATSPCPVPAAAHLQRQHFWQRHGGRQPARLTDLRESLPGEGGASELWPEVEGHPGSKYRGSQARAAPAAVPDSLAAHLAPRLPAHRPVCLTAAPGPTRSLPVACPAGACHCQQPTGPGWFSPARLISEGRNGVGRGVGGRLGSLLLSLAARRGAGLAQAGSWLVADSLGG